MKYVSFEYEDGDRSYGTVHDNTILDAGAQLKGVYPDLRSVIEAGAIKELAGLGSKLVFDSVKLLPPIPYPDKILCIGLNYLDHIEEVGVAVPEYPAVFTRYPSSLVGHDAPLVRPKASKAYDFEGELAVVIGKTGRHIPKENAFDHVIGYTCFNDGSLRDFQVHTNQFWPGKSFQSSGSMGPWLISRDEVGEITKQTLTTRINGNVEQEAGIDSLTFGIGELIAYISTVIELLPGDVIATGTPGGVGGFRSPPLHLIPGMKVDVEVTGVGTLTNVVIDEI
ncbi:fumarylacetoacetate hydrolase family protein [uncultured Agrobacterium sp.]|uniref:fumarylacetoacetate hydrolase family protein n=1 Tax=uncultured Agrobacterium sp. TaxID=157277 RepID=UPI0025F2BF4D|nr:fumarylacetoacetate hydrolase family protein [uncultured Agrobacterium sp.]